MLYAAIAVPVLIVLVGAVLVISIYNNLVTARNRASNAFAQIDVQLKRRYDLIPNLVETVKGYMAHERETLEAVVRARNAASTAAQAIAQAGSPMQAPSLMQNLMGAEQSLGAALGRFRVVSESYPELKANTNTALLMEELSSTENRIAFARQAYNDATMFYNTRRETFPANLLAGSFGFAPGTLFVVDDARERANVNVSLA